MKMQTEYEATFANINKDEIRDRLKKVGGKLIKPEFVQRRANFHLPPGNEIKRAWLRVRDEGDQITLSLKSFGEEKIEDQMEHFLKVDNYDQAVSLLELLGCKQKSYQETKRELWQLDGTDVTIDEWPYLEPMVEVEGPSEEIVKKVSEKLGFDYTEAVFGPVTLLYRRKYGLSEEVINNQTPLITFSAPNPFINR